MSFRKTVVCFIVFILLISACLSSKRPNIIIIVADDLGYNDVGFHGSDQIPTPNIDYLAYNGILLNNYYVSPICTPTRAALLTGRHPIHTGTQHSVIFGDEPWGLPLNETLMSEHLNRLGYKSHIVGKHSVIIGDQPYGLPLNETLMSEHLNKLGYRSHIVGKWHLGMVSWDYTPLHRGFESHLGYYQGCEDYYDHTYEADLNQWGLDFRRDKELLWNYTGKYSTDVFREEAVKVINNHNKSQPLFLYLPFQAVHSSNGNGPNLQAPLEYINKFKYIENKQRRIYAAMVSALDDAVGNVYDALKETDLLSNSIIVFTTDNGGPANGFDFNAASNFPLRGVKATLWEGGVRGVGLVHSPLLKSQPYVSNQMLHVCDWLPTLYSAAGGNVSDLDIHHRLDGYDSWDMLSKNGPAVRNEILHNIDPLEQKAAIRVGDYKMLMGGISLQWGGWYPPWKLDGDEKVLHYLNVSHSNGDDSIGFSGSRSSGASKRNNGDGGRFVDTEDKRKLRDALDLKYSQFWPSDVLKRLQYLYNSDGDYDHRNSYPVPDGKKGRTKRITKISSQNHGSVSHSSFSLDNHLNNDLNFNSEKSFSNEGSSGDNNNYDDLINDFKRHQPRSVLSHHGSPVEIKCGDKPVNASTNCHPLTSFCLYKISEDPCEYNNIAEDNPDIVVKLMTRLNAWTKTMVKPGNLNGDDKGNPKYHGGAWVPWR